MLVSRNINENMVVKKLMTGQSGSETVTNLDGSELLLGYASVKENGWGIVVATPVQSIKDQLFYHFKNVAITVAIPLLLLIFAVVILARSIANPFLGFRSLSVSLVIQASLATGAKTTGLGKRIC